MVHTAFTNDAIDTAIEAVHEALDGIYRVNPVKNAVSLDGLNTANARLRELLPKEAAKADDFVHDEDADSRDYESFFTGLSLVAMYTMMEIQQLNEETSLISFTRRLTTLTDDASDLASYASNWDWEHGVFTHPGDED